MKLPADGSGTHFCSRDRLKLVCDSFNGGQTTFQRYFLKHFTVLLFKLMWSAAPGQSSRYTLTFPPENDSAHGGPGHIQQGRNLTDRLLTHVTSYHCAPLKVT